MAGKKSEEKAARNDAIRERLAEGESVADLAQEYALSKATVVAIRGKYKGYEDDETGNDGDIIEKREAESSPRQTGCMELEKRGSKVDGMRIQCIIRDGNNWLIWSAGYSRTW